MALYYGIYTLLIDIPIENKRLGRLAESLYTIIIICYIVQPKDHREMITFALPIHYTVTPKMGLLFTSV